MTEQNSYLLDTTALIDFSKGFEPAKTKILNLLSSGEFVAVCSVTVAEFATGLAPAQREEWQMFLAALPYWNITPEAAFQAGVWRYDFSRRGVQLSTTDALIAATAWQQQAIIITNNSRHYPMAEVRLLSARD
jgi:predicted nucleic acid-binding protein